MLLVEQQNWIDPILMYRETQCQLGYRYFIMCQVLPLLVRLHHKTYEHSDTIWMWQGYQTLCPWQGNYKDDLCSYRIVLHCVAWCSCGNCYSDDGEIHSGAPLMQHGIRHRLAGHVTKLLSHGNIDDAEWVKEYMPGNEDNVIVSPRAM